MPPAPASTAPRIAVLSNRRSPLIGRSLKALHNAGLDAHVVFFDSRLESDKDLRIWQERTGGKLPALPLPDSGCRAIDVEDTASPDVAEWISSNRISVVLNCGTPRILKADMLHAPQLGVLNVHPGVLPWYRGASCVEWALYNNDPVGNSAHFMVEGIDAGPVLAREFYLAPRTANYQDVRCFVYERGFDLMAATARQVIEKGLGCAGMPAQGEGTYYHPIDTGRCGIALQRLERREWRFYGDAWQVQPADGENLRNIMNGPLGKRIR